MKPGDPTIQCGSCANPTDLVHVVPIRCGCLVCKPCVRRAISSTVPSASQAHLDATVRKLFPEGCRITYINEDGGLTPARVVKTGWKEGEWMQCNLQVAIDMYNTDTIKPWQVLLPEEASIEQGEGSDGRSFPQVSCPTGCGEGWLDRDEILGISPASVASWEEKALQAFSLENGYVQCPNSRCGMLVERLRCGFLTPDSKAVPPDATPRSRAASEHREKFRYRCAACGGDFCGVCLQHPYHQGFTCREARAPDCRFCSSKILDIVELDNMKPKELKSIARTRDLNPETCLDKKDLLEMCRLALRTCQRQECIRKQKSMCNKELGCGHHCCGLHRETTCLPCVEPGCPGPDPSQPSSMLYEDCQICWEALKSGPCIKISCGHLLHLECARQHIQKGYPGPYISFKFLHCPLCGVQEGGLGGAQSSTAAVSMDHPSLAAEIEPFLNLRKRVAQVAKRRLMRVENIKTLSDLQPGGRFDGRPADLALQKYLYFQCHKCGNPYFGGERVCQNGQAEERGYEPEDLVCGSCSAVMSGDNCPQHGADAIEWKCRYCCSVAAWFCWGTTHMCDPCHSRCGASSSPKLQSCSSFSKCPLGTKHPPPGQEFCLGCALCRHKEANTVAFSSFAYLFSELIQYSQRKVKSTTELEQRLEVIGSELGCRLLELLSFREKIPRRKCHIIDILKFIHSTVWPYMFGKTADSLEQANVAEDEYMISDLNLQVSKFVSVPRDMGSFNPGAFMAGVVKGVLDAAEFPARVSVHFVEVAGSSKPQTTILMKFDGSVMQREARLKAAGV